MRIAVVLGLESLDCHGTPSARAKVNRYCDNRNHKLIRQEKQENLHACSVVVSFVCSFMQPET